MDGGTSGCGQCTHLCSTQHTNGKTKVLHRARLLLWLADYTQDGLEVNVLSLEDDVVPCTTLRPIPYEGEEGGTP